MLHVAGICILVLFALLLATNAAFMLASPRAWFRLPGWLKAQGSLTEEKYSRGWGAIQIRLTGAAVLAVMAWVLYDSLLRPR